MANKRADLITHPVRSRIIIAMRGRQLTTGQLAEMLPDVPLPSLYLHVRQLLEGEILNVVEEVRVKGALTRVYALNREKTHIALEDLPQDRIAASQFQGLTVFMNTLSSHFRTHLETQDYDPKRSPMHIHSEPLYIHTEDYRRFVDGLMEYLKPWREPSAGEDTQRILFASIVLPDREDPPIS
jgi:hypothetical protein